MRNWTTSFLFPALQNCSGGLTQFLLHPSSQCFRNASRAQICQEPGARVLIWKELSLMNSSITVMLLTLQMEESGPLRNVSVKAGQDERVLKC